MEGTTEGGHQGQKGEDRSGDRAVALCRGFDQVGQLDVTITRARSLGLDEKQW